MDDNGKENGSMIGHYKESVYMIHSLESLYEYAENLLTTELAIEIPLYLNNIMEEVHIEEKFYEEISIYDIESDYWNY